jgi:chromosomal replication initiation ATPase DnaA
MSMRGARPASASLAPAPGAALAAAVAALPLSPAQALRRICAAAFGLTEAELIGRSRLRELALARQATCYVLRHRLGLSLAVIGRMLGGRDHTSVLYAIRQTEARIARDVRLAVLIEGLLALPLGAVKPHRHGAGQ